MRHRSFRGGNVPLCLRILWLRTPVGDTPVNLRSAFLSLLCLGAFAAVTHSQTHPTFTFQSSTAAPFADPATSNQVVPAAAAIDVNNDGIQDIVQLTPLSSGGMAFAVEIANGDGTFKAPASYVTVDATSPASQVASEDFNNDGKVDLAFAVQNTARLVIFLGKGDGTFQPPQTLSLPMPQGNDVFIHQSLVAADFNRDGQVDLAAETQFGAGNEIIVFPGDGNGSFRTPVSIWIEDGESPNPQLMVGNFNGDKKADLAFTMQSTAFGPCTPSGCPSQLVVLLGNGDLTFQMVLPMNVFLGAFPFGVGDLNNDGNSDIFGIDIASGEFDVIDGSGSGNLTLTSQSPAPNIYSDGPLYMADFNDDLQQDVVLSASSTPGTVANGFPPPDHIVFFLGQSLDPPTYPFAAWSQPVSSAAVLSSAIVGQFNHHNKPDIAVLGESSSATSPVLLAGSNAVKAGFSSQECNYPAGGQAIAICKPAFIDNNKSTEINVSAASFGLPWKIETWLDGKKKLELYYTWEHRAWMNWLGNLTPGSHTVAFVQSDVDNRQREQKVTFTVPPICTPPTSPGVRICTPVNGSHDTSPVDIWIAGNPSYAVRTELWINGKKVTTEIGGSNFGDIETLAPSPNPYRIVAIEVLSPTVKYTAVSYVYVH